MKPFKGHFILTFFGEGVLALYARDFLPLFISLFFSTLYHLGFGSVVIYLFFKIFSVPLRVVIFLKYLFIYGCVGSLFLCEGFL